MTATVKTRDFFAAAYLISLNNELKKVRLISGKNNKAEFTIEGEYADMNFACYIDYHGIVDVLTLKENYVHLQKLCKSLIRKSKAARHA